MGRKSQQRGMTADLHTVQSAKVAAAHAAQREAAHLSAGSIQGEAKEAVENNVGWHS